MAEQSLMGRDINDQFLEFMETVVFLYSISTFTDPYSLEPIKQTTGKMPLNVSWHDVTTASLKNDNSGEAILGVLIPGDAFCIYQGSLNLFTYQLPSSTLTRRGITYIVETVTNPTANRWIISLKRVR